MVIIMDMSTGKKLEELGDYGDEVLNANWLPQPDVEPGLQSAAETRHERREPPQDPDAILQAYYLNQE